MTGQTVSHYRILEKLGEGGMGVVWKAEDIKLKRTVALKFVPADAASDPELCSRFRQEAQAAAALSHPNVCKLYAGGRHFMNHLSVLTLCLVVFTTCAMGQAARTATLVGTVTDPAGALVPNAQVTLTNLETSFVANGVTNVEGSYYIPFLAVGMYELRIEASGFKSYVQKGIELRAAEVPRMDVKLEVGATSESVQVTGSVPLLATETSQVSQTMENKTIEQLPVLQMKAQRLLYYVGGLQIRGADASVVGQASSAIGFTLDGVSGKTSVRDAIGDTNTAVQPALDALAEAKVYTTGAPAELGHASGGILAFTFKSGTNEVHGSVEDRWTNSAMTHRGYLEQGNRTYPMNFHQLQGTVSGPIVLPKIYNGRNRTFFLFAYGRHDERAREPQTGTVPDLNMLAGDFSFPQATGGGYPIYDPKSMRQSGTTWTADPFAGMKIPTTSFDKVITNFLALKPWAEPNNAAGTTYSRTGPTNNWLGETLYSSFRSRYDSKIDHQISAGNKFFIRNSWNRHRQPWNRNQFSVNNKLLESNLQGVGRPNPIDQQNWAFADYHTFTPTMMNEVRLGFGRRVSTISPPTVGQGWAAKLGIPNVGPENFPGFGLYNIGPGAYQKNVVEDITFQNNVTKLLSRHTFKFGYEVIRTRENNVDQKLPSGSYSFGTGGTAFPFKPNTGHTFASFVLGSVTSATYTQQIWNRLPRWWSHSGYVQTDWKARRNLTFNLGLRYSLETPFRDKWDHQSVFAPNVVDSLTGKMGAITHPTGAVYETDRNNFQPRVGVAWNYRSNMVFRGSFGVLAQDLMPSVGFQEYQAAAVVQSVPGDPRPAFYLSQGPPDRNFIISPDGTSQFVGTNYSSRGAGFVDTNLRMPYVMNWSAGVQTQMGPTWLTELVYQGSSGVHLTGSPNINQLANSYYASTDLTLLNAVYNATQNYRPYTQFGTISYLTNPGHNNYHGLVARAEKRYSPNGLTLNAHYTWSKNLSGSSGDGWQYYNWSLTKAPTNFDTRHRFILQGMYDVPVGKGRRFLNKGGWLNAVLGGWNVVMIETIQSGPAVTFSFSGSPSRYLSGGPSRPHQLVPNGQVKVANWSIGEHRFPQSAQSPLYNLNSFAYPAQFTYGSLGAGTQRGLWLIWPQYSLSKSWAVERYRFSVRADANSIPARLQSTTPDVAVNLTNPATFGKFGSQTGSSYSTMGSANGQIIISGRFEF